MRIRVAPKGNRAVYMEHGVWYDPGTKHVHVTLGDAHWSYSRFDRKYAMYQKHLQDADRWPRSAPDYEGPA